MKNRKHVSEEERKKRLIIFVLIGILIAITLIIVIMFFPKGKKDESQSPIAQPQETVNESVIEKEQTNKVNLPTKNIVSNIDSNSTEDSNDLDIIAKDKNKVTMSIKPGTLTVDGAVIVITDTNISPYTWVPEYRLQQKIDDNWQNMELKNPENAFFPEIQTNNESGILEQSLVWVNKYGSLGTGQYRIVKESGGNEFYAMFEVQ